MSPPSTSRRDRLRQEATAEIKQFAMRQLAESGSEGISITAIAKQMGMTGPALYRYFTNRDALLTALIRDGYSDLADAAEHAAADAAALPAAERLHVVADVVRRWALAEPQRYLLLFGTPVPGYEAPMDTLAAASRTLDVLTAIGADLLGKRSGAQRSRALTLATTAWTRLHGVISLELVGQFTHLDIDPEALLRDEMTALVAQVVRSAN
jgi:AcrR family transcriptional regulator